MSNKPHMKVVRDGWGPSSFAWVVYDPESKKLLMSSPLLLHPGGYFKSVESCWQHMINYHKRRGVNYE